MPSGKLIRDKRGHVVSSTTDKPKTYKPKAKPKPKTKPKSKPKTMPKKTPAKGKTQNIIERRKKMQKDRMKKHGAD